MASVDRNAPIRRVLRRLENVRPLCRRTWLTEATHVVERLLTGVHFLVRYRPHDRHTGDEVTPSASVLEPRDVRAIRRLHTLFPLHRFENVAAGDRVVSRRLR